MSDLSYPDHCIITRERNGYDKYDEPLKPEVIYDDKCDYQPGGQTALSIVTKNAVIYLPRAVMVLEGDVVDVTSRLGRTLHGIVTAPKDLESELMGDCVTEFEIKQGTPDGKTTRLDSGKHSDGKTEA